MHDELVGGPGRERSAWWSRVALVVVVLAAVGVGVERYEHQRQLDALLTAAADAEQVVDDSRRSLAGLVQYSSQLLSRSDLAPEQREAVLASFALDAQRFPPRMARPRAALEDVRALPWHDELASAREAYLDRVDAWTAFVDGVQADPSSLLFERRATRPSREAAAQALSAAADDERVREISATLLSR